MSSFPGLLFFSISEEDVDERAREGCDGHYGFKKIAAVILRKHKTDPERYPFKSKVVQLSHLAGERRQ